ncbi:helix-turn-helix domain-containing protein [Streptomyces prunicolor]|uniref:helix-turn-helix domain-containing protein n=1 Tax=Streptomyces prunicolor TaxID=67348 RepID=UPI003715F246
MRKRTASQALVLRSRIVPACAEGRANAQVALDLGVSRETVRKRRARFLADRLEGLVDRPRSGAPRKITDEQVKAHASVLTAEHWRARAQQPTVVEGFGACRHMFRVRAEPEPVDVVLQV